MTLTLSIAYLSVLAHQRNRQRQGEVLRANAYVLNTLSAAPDTPVRPPPPTRAELAALQRASFVETAKDRGTQRSRARCAGRRQQTGMACARASRMAQLACGHRCSSHRGRENNTGRCRSDEGNSRGSQVGRGVHRAEGCGGGQDNSIASDNRRREQSAAAKGVFQKGVEKGKGAVDKAKAKAELAGESLESKIDRAMASLSDVDKALQQRYERKHDIMTKSINEVLDERYRVNWPKRQYCITRPLEG